MVNFSPGFELTILIGAVGAGLLGALLGLGGGTFIIPMLTALGVDIRHAIAVSIVAVIATSCGAASSYVRDGLANIRIGIFLCVATTTGALFGAGLNGVLPTRALFLIFAAVLGWSGVIMFRKRGRNVARLEPAEDAPAGRLRLAGRFYDPALGRERRYVPRRPGVGFGLMVGAGTVSGLLGIGSGGLKVPAMDLAMDLPIKVSTATSNFMIGITGLASALVYLERGQVLVSLVGPIALGVLAGAAIGTRLLPKLAAATIRAWFVGVLGLIVVQMLYQGLTQ
ncbi:MAG TPA: sulfite exporter TauE/SafE family protein [Acidimicrobiia bacterium]|nr:sulfite exporter TauE/SafE family protein [Acidimicrobiia bacterium]